MDERLDRYKIAFEEQFPLLLHQGVEDDEIVAVIDACLESGRPFEPNLEPGAKC